MCDFDEYRKLRKHAMEDNRVRQEGFLISYDVLLSGLHLSNELRQKI